MRTVPICLCGRKVNTNSPLLRNVPEVQTNFNAALRYVRKVVAFRAIGKLQGVQLVKVCVRVSPRNAPYKQKEYAHYEQDQDEVFLPHYAAASRFRLAAW